MVWSTRVTENVKTEVKTLPFNAFAFNILWEAKASKDLMHVGEGRDFKDESSDGGANQSSKGINLPQGKGTD